jgi:hypothetical protein
MDFLAEGDYQTSNLGCNNFFQEINGRPMFFTNELDDFDPSLITAISGNCPSKNVEVTKKDVSNAVDLIKDCWFKSGSGANIYAANSRGIGLCLYCGTIKSDEEITNFNELLKQELKSEKDGSLFKNNTGIVNLNPLFLDSLPKNINKDKSIQVFYYIYRPEYARGDATVINFIRDTIGESISKLVGTSSSYGAVANYYISGSTVETFGGILVSSKINNDDKNLDEVKNLIDSRDCTLIIPDENFD